MNCFKRFLGNNYPTGIKKSGYLNKFSKYIYSLCLLSILMLSTNVAYCQRYGQVNARMSASQITIGDQARLFLEAQVDTSQSRLEWATIPDSANRLEIVEKGKIDTLKNGNIITYKQRLLITSFDSGICKVPSFAFTFIPKDGTPPTQMLSDSFQLTVQTIPVDTTKGFKPIKGIIFVKPSWLDYIWYIVGGIALGGLIIAGILYYLKNKKKFVPLVPEGPVETFHERAVRKLKELEAQQLWQKDKVKEYYVELTDIVRAYIEARFRTPALELTTDELLQKAKHSAELLPYYNQLSNILNTADLAKFAKAKPLPEEHVMAMDNALQFVEISKPIIQATTQTTQTTA